MKQSYSLALGGGAARWLSYIWVIQYLEEKNIKIIELSGTSIWAIIAALYAMGKSSSEMKEIAWDIHYLKLIDLKMKHGVLKWNKVYKKLHSIFWDICIEELTIPLKIVATCITTWEKKVFTTGKLIDAIRASISLPWIFEPYKIEGNMYLDGGIVNNLPIEVLDGKNVIAVTALKKWNEEMKLKRKVAWIDFNVWFFTMNFQVLQKTIILMMKQNELRSIETSEKNVILIEPKYGKLEFYSFNKLDELISVGYEAVKNTFKI
jgi:NTE family protein